MAEVIWQHCLGHLQEELPSQQFNTWIKPLQIDSLFVAQDSLDQTVRLIAPNRFVKDWVVDKFLDRIMELAAEVGKNHVPVEVGVETTSPAFIESRGETPSSVSTDTNKESIYGGSTINTNVATSTNVGTNIGTGFSLARGSSNDTIGGCTYPKVVRDQAQAVASGESLVASQKVSFNRAGNRASGPILMSGNRSGAAQQSSSKIASHPDSLNADFRFDNFIEGKSNQLALAAAKQIAENPGGSYNPLFIYGGVGLGKTHLMHAVGNALKSKKSGFKIVYLHSERFVADMVKALQLNAINDFKRFYRSVDALLIDDIQFFAGKDRSQEEFFHTFNALLEGDHQMILTCDRYPKEIDGLEERLKSRFGWGLTVAVEPPELETRVAILIKKALGLNVELPHDAAFFIAQRISSNVRELEGALKRVVASAHFTGRSIDVPLVRDSLKDLLALQDRLVTVDNIQRTVADYYKIKMSDMLSKRRTRSVARPRQVAMAMAKKMTNHSLPEIGEAFGGRDHTTVLHACRKVKELQDSSSEICEDIRLLTRLLTN